jgi:hypothetical protein
MQCGRYKEDTPCAEIGPMIRTRCRWENTMPLDAVSLPSRPDAPLPDVPQLVGEVYAQAPAPLRSSLVEQLMRPLGLLSLVAVAGGAFARLKSRSGWHDGPPPLEHLREISAGDVAALAEHVQQVSSDAIDALLQGLANSPLLAGSAIAAVLAVWFARQGRRRS